MGNDAQVERGRKTESAEEKIAAEQNRDGIAQTLRSAFTIHRALGEDRSQQPDNEKNAPASADNIFHQRIQGVHVTPKFKPEEDCGNSSFHR